MTAHVSGVRVLEPRPSDLAKRLQQFRKEHWTHWTADENQLVVDCFHALRKLPDGVPVPAAPQLPEGFRLLPVEATDSMMDADWNVTMSEAHSNGGVAAAAWRAMVEAAPQVTYGNGHSGPGWYMHDTEYPEEGAVFLSDGVTVPVTITENGVAKVKASDVLKTPEAQKQLDAVKRLRDGVALPHGAQR